jgi:tyrosyl-tRNA synthetase
VIKSTLTKIEKTIQQESNLPDKDKAKLLSMLTTLKVEIKELSKIHSEEAESIVGFIERSTQEASRKKKNATLLQLSIDGIKESVKEFELSHPKLVESVNYISSALANFGI